MPNYKLFTDRQALNNWMQEYDSTYSARRSPLGAIGRPGGKVWRPILGADDLPGYKRRCEVKRESDSKRVYAQFDDQKPGILDNKPDIRDVNAENVPSVIVEPDGNGEQITAVDIMRLARQELEIAKEISSSSQLAGKTMREALQLSAEAAERIRDSKTDSAKAELYRQFGLAGTLAVNRLMQLADKKLPKEERDGLDGYRQMKAAASNAGINIEDFGITDLLALGEMKTNPVLREHLDMVRKTVTDRIAKAFAEEESEPIEDDNAR